MQGKYRWVFESKRGNTGLDRCKQNGRETFTLLPVYLPAMPDQMNHNYLLGVKNLVHDAVVTDSQLVEPCQIATGGIWFHRLYVSCQPLSAFDNATCDLLVKLREFACR